VLKVISSNPSFINEISPTIREEINGEYTLDFSAIIDEDKPITADDEFELDNRFQVATLDSENTGEGLYYNLSCEHVSYQLIDHELDNFANSGTVSDHLTALFTDTPFTVGTVEPSGSSTISINERTNKREILLQIAAAFNGELSYNGYEVSLLNSRGLDNGSQLRIGKNLKGIRKTIDKREKDAQGNPIVSYEVDVVNIAELDEYADVKNFESLELGDYKQVIDDELGINAKLRVVSLEYDPKDKRNLQVELSNRTKTIADELTVIQQEKVQKDSVYNGVSVGPENGFVAERSDKKARAIFNATEGITIQSGDGQGNYTDVVYIDTEGNATFTGLVEASTIKGSTVEGNDIIGGTVDIGNGTFAVDSNGNMVATSGTFEGDIKASNISGTSFNGGSISIGNGTFTVNSNGELEATNATIEGLIQSLYGNDYARLYNQYTSMGTRPMLELYESSVGFRGRMYAESDRLIIDADPLYILGSLLLNGSSVATESWVSNNFASSSHSHSEYTTSTEVQNMIDSAIADHESTYHSGS